MVLQLGLDSRRLEVEIERLMIDAEIEITRRNQQPLAHDDGAAHAIQQLPHIARPIMAVHGRDGRLAESAQPARFSPR